MSFKILPFANQFVRFAASFEFNKLRNEKGRNSELWFADEAAKRNDDKYFAIMDNENIENIKNAYEILGLGLNESEIRKFYLEDNKTQETINFILNSYNKYFPQIKSEKVYQNLENTEALIISDTPIFLIIHDLIHQTLEKNFVENLEKQNISGNTLLDELFEDLASSLSGFEPNNPAQGLFGYLNYKFMRYVTYLDADSLKNSIEKTFHIAKSELRGKIDKLSKEMFVSNLKIPNKIKQLVDGFLSHLKNYMLENIGTAQYHVRSNGIGFGKEYENIFWAFELESEVKDYYDKIRESQIIEQTDSSALRNWMLECLRKMKELQQYFKELPERMQKEFHDKFGEDEDEDEDENENENENYVQASLKIASKCQGNIIYIDDGSSEDWIDKQIPNIFKNSGIRMMFKDEVYSVFASEEKEEVYGVLVCHQSGYEEDELGEEKPIVYFSVAVKEECRKQNIATKLIENFVNSHKRDAVLKGEVWNPIMMNVLSKLGFIEEDDLSINPDQPIKLMTLK